MKLKNHIIASSVISSGLYVYTQSVPLAITSFLSGWLVDIDHFADYWREYPFSFNIKHFFDTCHETKFEKLFLWLHSFEILFFLSFILYLTRSSYLAGFTIGFAQHLLLDQAANPIKPLSYSLFFRWKNKFSAEDAFDAENNGHKIKDKING